MSFIGLLPEERASPALKELYGKIRGKFGFLPNYFQALARASKVMEPHLALGEAIGADGTLPAALKEQIGVVVSGINASSYCIAVHLELLRAMGIEKSIGRKLATDYPNAPVDEKEKALFRFADKLTRKPFDITREDVQAVRQAGWSEDALLETVLTVAWFNFINRFAAGLGLVADF